MTRPVCVWVFSFAVAIAAHLAMLFALFQIEPASGAIGTGAGGIEISLGPAGSAAGAQAVEAPVSEQDAEDTEPSIAETNPPSETVEAAAQAEEPVSPEKAPSIPDETDPVPERDAVDETPTSNEKTPVEIPDREPVVETVEASEQTPVRHVPDVRPLPRPAPPFRARLQTEVTPEPTADGPGAERTEQKAAAANASSVAGMGQSGTADGRRTGEQSQSAGGGSPGIAPDYAALLQAWLERHKTYPQRARARRQEGQVLLYFAMDRSGRVLSRTIRRGSGHPVLDEEALAMLTRAAPLPPFPPEMGKDRLELVVPVRFLLKDLR